MRSLFWILPLFLIPLALAYPTATAQNMTNTTGNGTESGGMSSESVESAQSKKHNGRNCNKHNRKWHRVRRDVLRVGRECKLIYLFN